VEQEQVGLLSTITHYEHMEGGKHSLLLLVSVRDADDNVNDEDFQ